MKKLLFFVCTLFTAAFAMAQNPVSWTFDSKKLGEGVYEVQMTATIQSGWHLYAQKQPDDAIAIPTTFTFGKNPLLQLDGAVTESGKMQKFHDKNLGVSANQYSDKVVFTQKVKVKGKAKTALTGKLEFQTCNDEKCLPPKTVPVSVALK